MKTAFHHAALACLVILVAASLPAFAESVPAFELKLDIDQDGKTDRVVVMQELGAPADLSIYLAAGDEKLAPSRQPDFVRKGLIEDRVTDLESKGKGSLVITSCFGCGASKSTEDTLTIVYRQGQLLVGGYSRSWDWNEQTSDGVKTTVGGCDINYLTGIGTVSKDLGHAKPIKGKFKPVALKDWSIGKRPKACEF